MENCINPIESLVKVTMIERGPGLCINGNRALRMAALDASEKKQTEADYGQGFPLPMP